MARAAQPVVFVDNVVSAAGDATTSIDTKRQVNPLSDFTHVRRKPMLGISGHMQFFVRTSGGTDIIGAWAG